MFNFTYVAEDESTGDAIVIDPSWDLDRVEEVVHHGGLTVGHIINTHHHFDHVLGNEAMVQSTGAAIVQHKESGLRCDTAVRDGDIVQFGNSSLLVRHTPGHSRDSICLVGDGKIFTGDTLFVGSCGRVDLPGGSARDLYHSIFDVLYAMDDGLEILPGHNYGRLPTSTIGREKATNPVMRRVPEAEFVRAMGQ